MAGPTVAGSIVAKLRVDSGTWDAELAAAGARADDLGRHDPHIKVNVDSAEAIAKMAAVNAAEKKLDIANQALRISYLRLDEAQTKGGLSASRLAALHLAAARAESAHESATKRLAAAQLALKEAEDEEEHSASRANNTHGSTISRMGLIIAAITVLVPMLGALTGYAVGVAGALAGMGAAGVLAIIGIKQAMDSGNATGQHYSAGLQTLKSDMNALASTSAGAMLYSFQQAVGMINADMPTLNGQISSFSQMLGNLGTTVLAGVLNSFKILNPLFVQAGQYVQSLAAGFKSWTENGGLQKFALFAENSLPRVAATLGSLTTGALHLVEALTPLGTVVLAGLKGFGDFLAGIPSGVLVDLAAGATSFFIAFKGWAALTPIIQGVAVAIGAVGAAEDLALGPIGLVIAAVTAAAAIFAVNAASTDQASAAQVSYTSALQASNGAIDESIRKSVAKQLSDEGALRTAKKYHLDLSTVTDAVLGNAAATKTVTDSVRIFGQQLYEVHGASGSVTNSYTAMSDEGRKFLKTVTGQTGALHDSVQAYKDQTAAASESGSATSQTATDLGISEGSYQALSGAIAAATQASKDWKTEQDILNGVAQSVEAANITMAQAYQSAATAIEANIKASDATKATSLDINTQYGAQNHQLILGQVQDAQAVADAQIASYMRSGDSQTEATNKANANLASQKQSIIEHMVQLGLDRDAVTNLVNSELTIPPKIEQTFTLKGVEDGTQKLSDYLKLVSGIHDITQRITVEANYVGGAQNLATTGGGYAVNENGNMYSHGAVQAFADGGFPTGIYQGRPQGIHKFAEQQTGWEAYISGKPGQEARNTGIALKALSKLGYQPPQQQYAQAPSLTGLSISGVLDMGNGLTGMLRGVIQQELTQQGAALSNGVRPLA